MSDTVGIGVLVEDTGETARTLQHWCDLGVLEPLPGTHKQGRGVAREFPATPPLYGERAMALIASRLNRLRIPLATVKGITGRFRKNFSKLQSDNPPDKFGLDTLMLRALSGRLEVVAFDLDRLGMVTHTALIVSIQETDDMMYSEPDIKVDFPYAMAAAETGFFLNVTKTLRPLRSAK